MKIFITMIALSTVFSFCSNKKIEQKLNNEYLECKFIQSGLRSPAIISCNYLNSNDFEKYKHNKLIDTQKELYGFKQKISNLTPSDEQDEIDARIQIIYTHDEKKEIICMGEFFGISVNGLKMNDSKEFHNFIKEIIDYKYTARHPITGEMIPKDKIEK